MIDPRCLSGVNYMLCNALLFRNCVDALTVLREAHAGVVNIAGLGSGVADGAETRV
jgi:hypothetical protein